MDEDNNKVMVSVTKGKVINFENFKKISCACFTLE